MWAAFSHRSPCSVLALRNHNRFLTLARSARGQETWESKDKRENGYRAELSTPPGSDFTSRSAAPRPYPHRPRSSSRTSCALSGQPDRRGRTAIRQATSSSNHPC